MSSKLLVIDDDPNLTRMLEAAIPAEEFEVTIAHSGVEGIELVRQWQPHVIMLDLMMPGMDGWQICRNIRSFSRTPILILSAVVDPQEVMRALDAGANDYMVKPPALGVLISRLRRLVKEGPYRGKG
jgi:DNA-binding response OmpR family regulator